MQHDTITARALRLAEEFLAESRVELLELAHNDLDEMRSSAAELRALAADRAANARSTEHVAYVAVAAAFNDTLAKRDGRMRARS